jgi:hypothetical protein
MDSLPWRAAVTAVRAWTRLYTWRIDPLLAAARREEIESDLWEYAHDRASGGLNPAFHVVARLVLGMPADVGWRFEAANGERPGQRAALAAAVIAASALWILPAWWSRGQTVEPTRIEQCTTAMDQASTGSLTRADYRMRAITCAGAFFAARSSNGALQ